MKSLRKLLGLSGADKRLFLECLLVLAVVRIALTFSSYRVIEKKIASPALGKRGIGPGRIAWAVRNMAPLVPGATCLTQALAAQHLMARAGKASNIRIGVAKEPSGAISAHAWLMYEGEVVIGGADHDLTRYTTLTDLAPGSS